MVGRQRRRPAVASDPPATPATCRRWRCAASSLRDPRRGVLLDDVDLEVRAGEVMGVAGVAGNGQLELYEVAMGLRPPTYGHRHRRRQAAEGQPGRRRSRPAPSACPRTRCATRWCPGMNVLPPRRPRRARQGPQAAWASTGARSAGGTASATRPASCAPSTASAPWRRCRAGTSSGSCSCARSPASASSSSPPTRAAAWTSPPRDEPRSCCSNGAPAAPACC